MSFDNSTNSNNGNLPIKPEEKRRFIRLKYGPNSAKPYVMAFEIVKSNLPSRKDILFSGYVKDISVNGMRVFSNDIENYKNMLGKHILFFVTFQHTNFQRWLQGKVLYGKENEISVTFSKLESKNIYFSDGTSCKTYNLIPIEVLTKEQNYIYNDYEDSSWLTDKCKKNINYAFEKAFSSKDSDLFKKSLFSVINGVIQSYFFSLIKNNDNLFNLDNFISNFSVKFVNKIEYAIEFKLNEMREEHIFIPNSFGNIGKLFLNELFDTNFNELYKRRWEPIDFKDKNLLNESKRLGEFLFNSGIENYRKCSTIIFPNSHLRLAGDAYIEQLSMYMEGRQKEIREIFELGANDFQ